jgi:drug/metabolite transporter (DMT)-like permease
VDWRKKKILGIILALGGVLIARLELFISLKPVFHYPVYFFGVFLALAGLAVYATGMGKEK